MNDEKIWLETEDGQKLFIIKSEKIDMQEELNKTIEKLHQELQRKDNIIKFIKQYIDDNCWAYAGIDEDGINILLDKIKELENSGSDE